jgi:hypothetical protein
MKALIFLPATSIHSPDWADTREARSVIRAHSSGLEAGLGEEIDLLGLDLPSGLRLRQGLEAAAFMAFDPEGDLTFSLLTFDGIVGVPIDIQWRDWQVRMEWTHLSAHFADGIRHGDELPDSDQTGPFSREWVELSLGREIAWFRPYVGTRKIIHSADQGQGMSVQLGTVWNSRSSPGVYGGLDLQSRGELDWAVSGAMEIGVQWFGRGGGLQLGLCGYSGMDDAGKKLGESEQYLGLALGLSPPLSVR